jgi:NosR/NirI family transcriptional regulator, nitrous oxide reductase regulator
MRLPTEMRVIGQWWWWLGLLFAGVTGVAEQRFPPPDFESGYAMPETAYPSARGLIWGYVDGAMLVMALGLGSWLILKRRSRRAVTVLSVCSLGYFGFFRLGCVCAIGSVQNVTLAMFDSSYVLPLTVLVFFVAPLVTALFFGRTFCAAVCPHGALQDLVLVRAMKVPRWLDQGLGVIPYLFLGLGILFAATGSAFIICRYDPFVPLFRFSGGFVMLVAGGLFVLLSMFVGRPYCRFVCPYGVLLKLAAKVSRWHVRITPDTCTQCRLCEDSCPFGAIREPSPVEISKGQRLAERRRFLTCIGLIPVLAVAGGWVGSTFSGTASGVHPAVQLADLYLRQQTVAAGAPLPTVDALAYGRAARAPEVILNRGVSVRRQFVLGGWLFGMFAGVVVGVKLARFSIQPRRRDYEPDRGGCYACARCYEYCPQERLRQGLSVGVSECARTAPGSVDAGAVMGSGRVEGEGGGDRQGWKRT